MLKRALAESSYSLVVPCPDSIAGLSGTGSALQFRSCLGLAGWKDILIPLVQEKITVVF